MLEEASIYHDIEHMELPPDLGVFEVSRLCSFGSERRRSRKEPRLTATQLMDQAQEYLQEKLAQEETEQQQREEAQQFFDKLCQSKRPLSPNSEKYRIKKIHLEEKYHHVEAQTMTLRRRVQIIRKQVIRMAREKRIICNLLEERGIPYQEERMEIEDDEPIPSSILEPVKNVAWCPPEEECLSPPNKKKRPQIKKLPTNNAITAEQREEEERARQRIVSIIDSVFTETARKQAQANRCSLVEQFLAKKGIVYQTNGVTSGEQYDSSANFSATNGESGEPKEETVENGSSDSQNTTNKTEQTEKTTKSAAERQFINYRMVKVSEEEQKHRTETTSLTQVMPDNKKRKRKLITGEIGGLSYTYLSNEYETDSDDDSKKAKPTENSTESTSKAQKDPRQKRSVPRRSKEAEILHKDTTNNCRYDFDDEESSIDRTIKNVVLTSARCAEILSGVGISKQPKVEAFHRTTVSRSVAEA